MSHNNAMGNKIIWISTKNEKQYFTMAIHVLRNLIRLLVIFIVSIQVVGCACPPKYDVYPTLSLTNRIKDYEKGGNNPFDWWTLRFKSESDRIFANRWKPSATLLDSTFIVAAKEYGVSENHNTAEAQIAFDELFGQEKDLDNKTVAKRFLGMLQFIDYEHLNLLVDASRLKTPPEVNDYKLPSLVSGNYPVGVAITKWVTSSPPESKSPESNISIIGNTLVVPSDNPLVCTPEGSTLKCKQEKTQKDTKEKETKNAKIENYNPEQKVSLSISTVLNSPVAIDRIDYVSTYLYLEPYPFPPNGSIVLEKEFWRKFLALNMPRDSQVKDGAAPADMRRAIEDMRIRIEDIDTTVKLRTLDFGTQTLKSSDKFSAEIAATVAAPPTLTSLTPKLGYSTGVDTETSMKLTQELDQRSTYVDPSGHFLRITQRGMQSVNLAGRFVENIKLIVPASQEQFPVLVPHDSKPGEYKVTALSQPLYSRVDALTLSVVVARQATSLAKSKNDSFRLDDPKDAALIVGVTRPYRLTLWQNDRAIGEVMTMDILGNVKDNKKLFFYTFDNERPSPLRLFGFTQEQQSELLGKIRDPKNIKDGISSFKIDGTSIYIGLPDDPTNPRKLIGFK